MLTHQRGCTQALQTGFTILDSGLYQTLQRLSPSNPGSSMHAFSSLMEAESHTSAWVCCQSYFCLAVHLPVVGTDNFFLQAADLPLLCAALLLHLG